MAPKTWLDFSRAPGTTYVIVTVATTLTARQCVVSIQTNKTVCGGTRLIGIRRINPAWKLEYGRVEPLDSSQLDY